MDVAPSPIEAAWDAIRTSLRKSIGARTFDGWLKPLTLTSFESATGMVSLAAPSDFMANWVTTHFAEQLLNAWRAMLPEVRGVSVEAAPGATRPALFAVASTEAAVEPAEAAPAAPATSPGGSTPLESRYTFESFVVGKSNEVAYNAARTLSEGGPVA